MKRIEIYQDKTFGTVLECLDWAKKVVEEITQPYYNVDIRVCGDIYANMYFSSTKPHTITYKVEVTYSYNDYSK